MHPPWLHAADGHVNADGLVPRILVDKGRYEARILAAAGGIESTLRCLCCRLAEVQGESEVCSSEGIDAKVTHLAWEVVGGHQRREAIPEAGTPRIFLRNDTKLAVPSFLCDSHAVQVDERHQLRELCGAHGGRLVGDVPVDLRGDVPVDLRGQCAGRLRGEVPGDLRGRCAGRPAGQQRSVTQSHTPLHQLIRCQVVCHRKGRCGEAVLDATKYTSRNGYGADEVAHPPPGGKADRRPALARSAN